MQSSGHPSISIHFYNMLKFSTIALLGFSLSLGKGNPSGEKIPGCYIVSFKNNNNNNNNVKGKSTFGASSFGDISAQALLAKANVKAAVKSFGKITAEYDRALNGFTVCGVKSESQLNSIRSNAHVASIEQDQVVRASAMRTIDASTWGLDRIDQRSPSLDGKYTYNDTAAPVNVYVLDTGILTSHTQFEGRAFAGYNFVNNNADSNDCNGHGTHCAGTIGGKDYGVCKHCRLIAVKVLGCSGSGSTTGIISGINWAINHARSSGIPSVISMSLGGGYSASVNAAVNNAVDSGIVTVVAAGNDNADACRYSPASTPSAITVGAISQANLKSSYSNFGSCLDIFAPGNDITSAWIGSSNTTLRTISGTSMATPHVAGVAAVYRSYNPSKNATEVRNFLVDQISSLNAISNLDANSPNRVLYSRIENLNQTDRTLIPTVAPTRSPTLPPTTLSPTTASPTALTFSRNLLVVSSIRDYYGSEFNASISQFLFGEMFPLSVDNMDIDLELEVKIGAFWRTVRSSISGSSREQISFTATSAGTYRWRVYVFSGSSQMNITFRSNIRESVFFNGAPTLSPTNSPSAAPSLAPTNVPTLSPTRNLFNVISSSNGFILEKEDSSNRLFVRRSSDGVRNPITIPPSSNVLYNSFPGFQPLAVSVVNGVHVMIWLNTPQNLIHNWTLDSSWRHVSSGGYYSQQSAELYNFESQFDLDFNLDGLVGSPALSLISSSNGVNLERQLINNRLYVRRSNSAIGNYITIPPSSYVLSNSFPGFQPLAASVVNGANVMLWLHTPQNLIHNWTLDSSWRHVSSGGYYAKQSAEVYRFELQYNLDFNGNQLIGS